MKKIVIVLIPLALALIGCQNMPREDSAALLGGVIGAAVGHNFGSGHGKELATITGGVIGALAGASVGRKLDDYDALQTQRALEHHQTGETLSWVNPDTNDETELKPTRTYQNASTGQYCREYTTTVNVSGQPEQAYGTACRQPDGSWKIVN